MNDDARNPSASRGFHGDLLPVLRSLADGVRGMGLGDPDYGDRIEASDVVRWAVDEIERLRLTDAEREAIASAGSVSIGEAQNTGSDSWYCDWYRCPKCEREHIAYDFRFCPDCGVQLQWQA